MNEGNVMMYDFNYIILWWLYILLIGLIFLPLTMRLFNRFFDKGYLFSKTIGLAISSYLVWLFASFKLLPFTREVLWIALICTFAAILFIFKGYKQYISLIHSPRLIFSFAAEELIFFSALVFWAFLRGLKPDIEGLEKFMDLGFVNTILRSTYMPPADMWFAGESINYYYFGHYMTAFLTKLSNISSYITYNLMMSTLFAFCFSLVFSLTANLIALYGKKRFFHYVTGGMISAFLLSLGGNFHAFVFAYLFPALKKMGIKISSDIQIRDDYWFPEATRYIGHNPDRADQTIHEFPFYSFVVSDLHAHVINIPFVLTIIALILSFLIWAFETDKRQKHNLLLYNRIPVHIPFIAFFIGIFQMTNYWDFPIYFTVYVITAFYIFLKSENFQAKSLYKTAAAAVMAMLPALLVALPFSMNFINVTNGIRFTHTHSALYQLFIVWGYQFIFSALFIYYSVKRYNASNRIRPVVKDNKKSAKKGSKKPVIASYQENYSTWQKLKGWILWLPPTDAFVIILSLSAAGLILIPEIIYVKDIYNPPYHRANTMFKLTYQSFIMFSIAVGYIYIRLFSDKAKSVKRIIGNFMAVILLILPMIYTFFAIHSWYGPLTVERYKGLDGMGFLKEKYPDDYAAVQWLNENVKGQPTIVEANGDSYTMYDRISMATGLPTISGWYVHEWLWRNDYTVVSARNDEVKAIYESSDISETKDILNKYDVKYIIVGELEKEKFNTIHMDKLLSLGRKVFDSPQTVIIEIDKSLP